MSPKVHHLTAKRKDSRKKEKPHGKKKRRMEREKNLTAKKLRLAAQDKTSQQKK